MPFKFTKIEELTNDNLKLAVADDITAFIAEEIKKANESWKVKVEEKENVRKELETKNSSLASELEKAKTGLKELEGKVQKMELSEAQRTANEKFSQRMSAIDEEYEVSADERKVIAKNIQGKDDESFNSYFEDLKILFASKKKAAKKADKNKKGKSADDESDPNEKEPDDDADDSKKATSKKKAKASTDDPENEEEEEIEEVVEAGVAKAQKETAIPNTTDPNLKGYKDKYASAFEPGKGIQITVGKKTLKFE